MAVTQAISSTGTTLQLGDAASPEVFTKIAEVGDLSFGVGRSTREVTHQESPGKMREFIATLGEIKEISFPVNFRPAETTHGNVAGGLLKDSLDGTRRKFRFVFADSGATIWAGHAFVADVDLEAPVEGGYTASVTLRPTGQWTLA